MSAWSRVRRCSRDLNHKIETNIVLFVKLISRERAMINSVNEFLDDLRGGRMSEAPIVRVEEGQLQGKIVNGPSGKGLYAFLGVPYAKPPLGSLRFKAPQPHEPWEGIHDATSEGNVSAQIDFLSQKYIGDENCLFLNIYTPTLDGAFLPVMVYIHGGGLFFGSGNSDLYGPDYLVEKDVVVVTLNYRLGVLGFLGLDIPEAPGNAGAKDVVQALRWIKENIHNFGGNGGNITLFGESAGGGLTSMLTASPMSKNLISKAIIQSGTALFTWLIQKTPVENARKLAKCLGCEAEDPEGILEFLSSTPTKDMVEAHQKILSDADILEKSPNMFLMMIEKEFPGVEAITTEPFLDLLKSGRVAQVPTMIGSTILELAYPRKHDDLQIFIPEELHIERNSETSLAIAEQFRKLYFKDGKITDREYYQLTSDRYINIDNHRYIQHLLQSTNIPVYFYKFDYVGELNVTKKFSISQYLDDEPLHLDELGYLFKNDLQMDVEPTPQDLKMRERMVRLWTNFAKTGNPTPEENHYINVTWQPATKENEYYLHIAQELKLGANYDKEKMEFWDSLYEKYYKIWDQQPKQEHVIETPSSDPIIVETLTIVTNSGSRSETVTNMVEISSVVETSEVVETQENITPEVVETQEALKPEVVETSVETEVVDAPVVVGVPKEVEKPHLNGNQEKSVKRTSNEIKMVQNSNGVPKEVIRANDPPEDDLPKNIGVNKFVNFFESLGGKK